MSILFNKYTTDLLISLLKSYNNFISERKVYYIYSNSAKLLNCFHLEEPNATHGKTATKYELIAINAKKKSLIYFIEWVKIYKLCFINCEITPSGMEEIDTYIDLATNINININIDTHNLKIIVPPLDVNHSFLEKYTILNNIFKDYCKNCKNIQKSIESNALLCAKLDIINYKKNIILKTTINNNDIHIIQLFNDKYTRYKTALYNGNNTYIELYHKCFKSYFLHKHTIIHYHKLYQSTKTQNKRKNENNKVPLKLKKYKNL